MMRRSGFFVEIRLPRSAQRAAASRSAVNRACAGSRHDFEDELTVKDGDTEWQSAQAARADPRGMLSRCLARALRAIAMATLKQ